MSPISITKLYDLLSIKVGRETAENLTSFIEEKIKDELASKTDALATKEYVASKIEALATKEYVANTKSELIKWMFVFWVGQLMAFILLFTKK